jgi:thiol-disulfide isomerase/thioredoxin
MPGNKTQRSSGKNLTGSMCSLALAVVATAGMLSGCANATQKLTTGDVNLSFSNSHGQDVSLKLPCSNNCPANLKGKVVLVNFWATWCDPCRGEIPSLIEFQRKYSDKGFTLLGVAMDEDGAKVVQPFVQKTKFDVNGQKATMNYPIVIGNDSVADKFGGLIGYPTSVLLTRDGKVAKTILGPISPEDFKDIQNLIGS